MDRRRNLFTSWVFGVACLVTVASARGQTIERDTTITGPRGRSIQRQVEVQRGPGTIDRSIQIKRPGGTFDRSVQIQRSTVAGPWRGGGPGPRPWMFGPRPLIINQAAPAIGFGVAAIPLPFMNFSFGGGGGGGGIGVGGGMGMGGGPGPGGPPPGSPPPAPPDQVALMTQRLQSFYPSHRKEAAYTLGQLQDPRAVPALIHTLKYDSWKDVRIASAIALGEIGGSEAAVALERDAIYDHKEEVRKAASTALERLNAKAKAAAAGMSTGIPMAPPPQRPASSPSPFRQSPTLDGPASEAPGATSQPEPLQGDLVPPPPPTPVTSGPGGQ